MTQEYDRRHCERVDFLRPIVYIQDRSDRFVKATMLNFCSSGICFQTTPSVEPGAKIHILTEEALSDSIQHHTGEAILGEVMWCSQKAGAHWVGVHYIGAAAAGIYAEDEGISAIS